MFFVAEPEPSSSVPEDKAIQPEENRNQETITSKYGNTEWNREPLRQSPGRRDVANAVPSQRGPTRYAT